MGTKNNPGEYDCYAKLADDEPYFVLRGKDPSARYLVRIWVHLRRGQWLDAMSSLISAMRDLHVMDRASPEGYHKLREAHVVSQDMHNWRVQNVLNKPAQVEEEKT